VKNNPITWKSTGDTEFIYFAEINKKTFHIRLNDFPAEPMYTLIYETMELLDFDDWPAKWNKPQT